MLMLDGSRQALELWSTESNTKILQIEKKGDFGIREFAFKAGYIAYSDSANT